MRQLCGDNLVRIAFLDEAGRSRGEPVIVVAGPIVNGDRTYRQLVDRLRDITNTFLPEADRKGFVFHAKDIFHASGPYFKPRKNEWTSGAAVRVYGPRISFHSARAI